MKNTWKKTITFVCALAVVTAPVNFGGIVTNADGDTSDYTITIPATLTVNNVGWNSIGDLSATGTLADGKKLVVTATSDDEFALVNTSDTTQKVAYTINNANGDAAGDAATSWEFDSLSATASTKPIGIVVEDYSNKAAGTYQDVVTFTASVKETLQTFNSADVTAGTILHIGDKIEVGSKMLDFYGWSLPANNTYTLVRVNATQGEMPWDLDITESDAGAYYTFKGIENGSTKYRPSSCEDMPKATNTSDGVIVVDIGEFAPKLSTHEP